VVYIGKGFKAKGYENNWGHKTRATCKENFLASTVIVLYILFL